MTTPLPPEKTVLVESAAASMAHLSTMDGEVEAVALQLRGRRNMTDQRGVHYFVLSREGAAALVAEVMAVMGHAGEEASFASQVEAVLKARSS